MKKFSISGIKCLMPFLLAAVLFTSCQSKQQDLNDTNIDSAVVKDSVTALTVNIAHDLAAKGPVAWLNYFQDSPDFFMANEGQLALHNYQSAKAFIQDTLVKSISKINLRWSHTHIDPLAQNIAAIGSDFHEDITFAWGETTPFDGYFTGVAIKTPKGWKLRNAHWSIKPPPK